jgi:Fis family transcriptional regulator
MSFKPNDAQNGDQETEHAPLGHYVASCLDNYFHSLNGEKPCNLYRLVMDQVEAPLLNTVMHHSRGNQTRAAEMLGINRATLRKKLREHGLGDGTGN